MKITIEASALEQEFLALSKFAQTLTEISDGVVSAFEALQQALLVEGDSLVAPRTVGGVVSLYPTDRLRSLISAVRASNG